MHNYPNNYITHFMEINMHHISEKTFFVSKCINYILRRRKLPAHYVCCLSFMVYLTNPQRDSEGLLHGFRENIKERSCRVTFLG